MWQTYPGQIFAESTRPAMARGLPQVRMLRLPAGRGGLNALHERQFNALQKGLLEVSEWPLLLFPNKIRQGFTVALWCRLLLIFALGILASVGTSECSFSRLSALLNRWCLVVGISFTVYVCFRRLFGSTGYCAACTKVIPAFEMVMRARNNVYHLECFACHQCNHR